MRKKCISGSLFFQPDDSTGREYSHPSLSIYLIKITIQIGRRSTINLHYSRNAVKKKKRQKDKALAEDWSNSTMWLINANKLHSKLYKAPHEDKWECAAAQKRCQVHLEDQTAIEQIEFARMDVSGCNQSLCLAVAVTVCSVVHCSYSYLMKSNDADFRKWEQLYDLFVLCKSGFYSS